MSPLEAKCCDKALTSGQTKDDVPTLSVFPENAGPAPVKNWNYASLLQLCMWGLVPELSG